MTKGGRPHEVATGSSAVRQIIEEVQPLLSLHGHIHESKGVIPAARQPIDTAPRRAAKTIARNRLSPADNTWYLPF